MLPLVLGDGLDDENYLTLANGPQGLLARHDAVVFSLEYNVLLDRILHKYKSLYIPQTDMSLKWIRVGPITTRASDVTEAVI